MVFKITIFIGLMTFMGCQMIENDIPEPLDLSYRPTNVVFDSTYKTSQCNTSRIGYEDNNALNLFPISKQVISNFATYTQIRFEDPNGNFIDVLMKPQKFVPKVCRIIPYNPNLIFDKYNEVMVRCYHTNYNAILIAQNGRLSLNSAVDLGFCHITFRNSQESLVLSFTYK